ncbi:hypothetical protein [Streptomyces sp. GESEQ-4]|uniref:hypothetical protein n=1 Tax=Streptomyces sp. GESEQ-4 TaxID=2812655 RepID=UPI001B342E81|nr:hypothetical protein [Streptomyces sp. GESEQ-4]
MSSTQHSDALRAVQELRSAEGIVLHKDHIIEKGYPALSPEQSESVRSIIGLAPGTPVEDHRLGAVFVHAAWFTGDYSIEGEFRLHDIWCCLRGKQLNFTDRNLATSDNETLRKLKVLDQSTESGRLTGIHVSESGEGHELWFYDTNHSTLKRMEIDYRGYVQNLFIMKGVSGWQYLFTDTDLSGDEFDVLSGYLKNALNSFPTLFPRYDYSDMRARLEARL